MINTHNKEYYKKIKLAQQNDNLGVLENIYDNDIPHPYFNPKKIAFREYRLFHPDRYIDRNIPQNKIVVYEDREINLANYEKEFGHATQGTSPLTKNDYVITSWLSERDNLYPVPYVFNSWALSQTRDANFKFVRNNTILKPFIADVLFGNQKLHRNIFFSLLKEHCLIDKCIINYFGIYKSNFLLQSNDVLNQQIDQSNNILISNKDGKNKVFKEFWPSQIISQEIYDNSWLSVVAESTYQNGFFCPSEKIGKPLIAGRPFIVLAEKNYLKNLRKIGFSTFHPFIDESYDEIDDLKGRVMAAFRSFQKLMQLDQYEFFRHIGPLLQHNIDVMRDKSKLTAPARKFLDEIRTKYSI